MNGTIRLTGRLILAARGLVGVSRADLASASGISVETLKRMELNGGAWLQSERESEAVSRELEQFGVIFIPESDGMGAGLGCGSCDRTSGRLVASKTKGASRRMTTCYDHFNHYNLMIFLQHQNLRLLKTRISDEIR